jgi:Tfp pilus assembly protein PilV
LGSGYLDKVLALKPSTFQYNSLTGYDQATQDRTITGFIAQDLINVFPDMVGTTTINGTQYYDTNLSALPIYLVKAIQELNTKVDALASSTVEEQSVSSGPSVVSFLQSFGAQIVGNVLNLAEVLIQKATVSTLVIKNEANVFDSGYTIYDRATGQPICVFFSNGIQQTTQGACDSVDSNRTTTPDTESGVNGSLSTSTDSGVDTTGTGTSTSTNTSTTTPLVSDGDTSTTTATTTSNQGTTIPSPSAVTTPDITTPPTDTVISSN